ncbi:DUF4920 domain-containing protein [Flammeovirga pectinis]|uniref:DUF4920 domain-containing protein n=1 Tax=Flammeovirga pectinis TaxID=2494373 RepID=A0A3Q9FNQ5_9BACT|nr:DUF4920 domain-containing protein [Flammeovirga pectinis]AZQ61182.1 DUF4920 domain-containing protein [Flammeovirga pectinis]
MKLLSTILLCILFISCSEKKEISMYGAPFDIENAVASKTIINQLASQDTIAIKVKGQIDGVCQKKGCWLTMPMDDGTELFVKFKDYKFFVPMDSEGKDVILEGVAKKEVIDVATLKHYAEDAGKTPEEVAKITTPEVKYTFMANGVAVVDQL